MATTKKPAKKAADAHKEKGAPRNKKNLIPIGDKDIPVYATPRVSKALDELTEDMTLYHGVRFIQVIEAVYKQGQKDGARNAFGELEKKIKEAQKAIPHRNPGQPKKQK
ncbi:hypothetical protein [Dyella amyloliquefaciens]|uniref:hypothetical protein n=1 Tax=Dyella amyloliquefaciens TaxID=1770545 RepID=UPI00102EC226|nr:hypothetical protein [Dyella amyloliquefaciens]